MYHFIKSKHMHGSKEYETIDQVDINGEILKVDSTWDEKLQIECKLENIDKYINDNGFPDTIGFKISSDENDLPDYISIILLEKENERFEAEFLISLYYENWHLKWSIPLFGKKFGEVCQKYIIDNHCKADIEVEPDKDNFGAIIKFYLDELTSIECQISPLVDIITDIYNKTDFELLSDTLGVYSIKIPVNSSIKMALKQYLVYFPEYVEKTKGHKINFEVTSEDNLLNIQISKNDDYELIDKYFKEYIGFIKQSIDMVCPEIKNTKLEDFEKELFMVELRSQINHLKTTVQIKEVEIKYLERDVDRLTSLLEDSIKSNTKNQIALLVDSHSSSVITSNISVDFNLKYEINALQKEFLGLKEQINTTNNSVKDEIDKVDSELLKLDSNNVEEVKKNKHVFHRLRRLLEQVNDSNSDFNKTISLTKGGIKKAQQLAKIYNRFAQWLFLPQVPDIFLGGKDEKMK